MSTGFFTPLRYPGGKGKLGAFFRNLLVENGLCDCDYVEPFAGGAGVALDLLMTEHVRHIHLNDLSYPVFCFWDTVLRNPDYICRRIRDVKVTSHTWKRQKSVLRDSPRRAPAEVGFAFLFLNRTNRSGILNGGMIGGTDQNGRYRIDARFYRNALRERILRIAEYSGRITISCQDARAFLGLVANSIIRKWVAYLDPPYFVAGRRLYLDHLTPADHADLATVLQNMPQIPWIVTYDNAPEVAKLYHRFRRFEFPLRYSAQKALMGKEMMILSDSVRLQDPTRWQLTAVEQDKSGSRGKPRR